MQTALLSVLIGVTGAWVGTSYFPERYFAAFPAIPAFFFVLGWGAVALDGWLCRKSPRQSLQFYLLTRVMRMIVSLLVMVAYCILVPTDRAAFLLTFIAVYIVYLIYDSWHFSHEAHRNQKSPNQDEASV